MVTVAVMACTVVPFAGSPSCCDRPATPRGMIRLSRDQRSGWVYTVLSTARRWVTRVMLKDCRSFDIREPRRRVRVLAAQSLTVLWYNLASLAGRADLATRPGDQRASQIGSQSLRCSITQEGFVGPDSWRSIASHAVVACP